MTISNEYMYKEAIHSNTEVNYKYLKMLLHYSTWVNAFLQATTGVDHTAMQFVYVVDYMCIQTLDTFNCTALHN